MFGGPHISVRRLAELCRRVGTALGAGVDARAVLARETQRGGARQRNSLQEVSRRVDQGESLADALCGAGGFFPPLLCEMVRLGEETGSLAEVFLTVADHYDHRLKLRRIFLAGIAWPMIQLLAAVVIVGLLIWIMGLIGRFTGQSDEQVDMLHLGLVGNRGLLIYVGIVSAVAGLLLLLVKAVGRGMFWTAPIERAALAIPGLGGPLRTLALSRMAWALALTTSTSMDIRRAVKLSLASVQSPYYERFAEAIDRVIASGRPLHEALRETGAYTDDFLDAVETGEQSGRLSESMAHLSGQYQDRARAALGVLTVLAGFAVWAMVALLLVAIIIRLWMSYLAPIYDLLDQM